MINYDREFLIKGIEFLELASDDNSKLKKEDKEQLKSIIELLNDIKEGKNGIP